VPFYAFGPLKIVAVRDIGSLGSIEGPPAVISASLPDSLRSVYLWFVLGGLLLLRRANRTGAAWGVIPPLLAVYAILHMVERTVGSHGIWNVTPYLCSLACEMLRSLALGLAFLLAVSDIIWFRRRVLRAAMKFLIVVVTGTAAIALNAPLSVAVRLQQSTLNVFLWTLLFGIMVLVFMIGLGVVSALLRRLARERALKWCAYVCFALGAASILVLVGTRLLIGSTQLMSSRQSLFWAGALLEPFLAPYLVLFWFALLALLSPFYRQRFTNCFVGGATPSPGD
jgi:hypothetical protein